MSRLLERLRKVKDDRGMMANLRCILVDTKKHRAWPALHRLGIGIDNDVAAFVAGLYATHPDESTRGDFGNTCKAIEQRRGETRGDDSKITPMERRFQQLLTAERGSELHDRVRRMVFMAKAQGIPINYEELEADLRKPNEWRKTKWATSFWAQDVVSASEEAV